MKHCPTCLNEYADESQSFCGRDGTLLVAGAVGANSFLSLPVSPSEVALLCADQFVDIPGLSASRPQHLSLVMMSAMVLSNEQVGHICLQLEPRGQMMLHRNRLRVSAGTMDRRWPQWSMEDRFCTLLAQVSSESLDGLIYTLWARDFKRDVPGAWAYGRMLVMQGLAARSLIRVAGDWATYQAHESLAGISAPQVTLPLRRILIETMQRRPDVWAALLWDINYGVCRRAEVNSPFAIRIPL